MLKRAIQLMGPVFSIQYGCTELAASTRTSNDTHGRKQGRNNHWLGVGIGAATASAFAREGARVVVADINLAAAENMPRRSTQPAARPSH